MIGRLRATDRGLQERGPPSPCSLHKPTDFTVRGHCSPLEAPEGLCPASQMQCNQANVCLTRDKFLIQMLLNAQNKINTPNTTKETHYSTLIKMLTMNFNTLNNQTVHLKCKQS